MDIIDEKANDPHAPPMEAEEIVSVHDREPWSILICRSQLTSYHFLSR